MTTRNWQNITDYMDTVGTSLKTFTFPKTQNFVKVTIRGNANVTYTIGSQSGTLTPGQSISVSEKITSFTLTAASGTQTVEVWATEDGTQKVEDDSSDSISGLAASMAESASDLSSRAVNVKIPFGTSLTPAKVDGTTNDTSAIQAIINFVSSNGGGTVFIPSGTAMIDATVGLQMKSNIALVLDRGATIKAITNNVQTYNIINCKDIQNFKIVGGTIQGERTTHTGTGGEWGMGINVIGCSRFLIEDVYSRDCWGDGLYIGASTNQAYCEYGRIVNFTADNNRRNGISMVSGKDIDFINPRMINTNGTAPQAGIDIEPNDNTNFVEGINLINPYTKNNVSAGVNIALKNLDGSNKLVSVNVSNHRDELSGTGLTVFGSGGGYKGVISFVRPTYETNSQSIVIRDYSNTGARVVIEEPTCIDPNAANSASVKYGSAIAIFQDTTDTSGRTIGNVFIIRPTIKDTRATTQMQAAILFNTYVSGNTNANLQGVNIVDPIAIIGSNPSNQPIQFYGSGYISDAYKQMDRSLLNLSGDAVNVQNYYRSHHNENYNAARTVTLGAVPQGWPDITFDVRTAQTLTIAPNASDTISPLKTSAGASVASSTVGSRLTLRKIAPNTWFVIEQIGTWA